MLTQRHLLGKERRKSNSGGSFSIQGLGEHFAFPRHTVFNLNTGTCSPSIIYLTPGVHLTVSAGCTMYLCSGARFLLVFSPYTVVKLDTMPAHVPDLCVGSPFLLSYPACLQCPAQLRVLHVVGTQEVLLERINTDVYFRVCIGFLGLS